MSPCVFLLSLIQKYNVHGSKQVWPPITHLSLRSLVATERFSDESSAIFQVKLCQGSGLLGIISTLCSKCSSNCLLLTGQKTSSLDRRAGGVSEHLGCFFYSMQHEVWATSKVELIALVLMKVQGKLTTTRESIFLTWCQKSRRPICTMVPIGVKSQIQTRTFLDRLDANWGKFLGCKLNISDWSILVLGASTGSCHSESSDDEEINQKQFESM